MEKIFETEAIRIMVSESNDVYVTGKNQTVFTNEVLKSLGAEIYRLQNELEKEIAYSKENKKLFNDVSLDCLIAQEKNDLLSETVIQMQTVTKPMATLEHTSEPDIRHYHFFAELKNTAYFVESTFSVKNFNLEGFTPAIRQEASKLFWQKKMIKSNPEDWVIKSLSRL